MTAKNEVLPPLFFSTTENENVKEVSIVKHQCKSKGIISQEEIVRKAFTNRQQ